MLLKRILTALILIPLAIATLLYLPSLSFRYLTIFIVFGAAWDWARLIGVESKKNCFLYSFFIILMCLFSTTLRDVVVLGVACAWWMIACLFILFHSPEKSAWQAHRFEQSVMGVIVLVPCWLAINFIRQQSDGTYALLFLFAVVWSADTAAFFVGRKWGKHFMAPRVSPGKSWEGIAGACFFSSIVVGAGLWWSHVPSGLWPWAFVLCWITIGFAVIGDLFESLMKRAAGVKDSGRLLPGHGGVLDRIDSLTAAAPVFAFGAWLLGTYGGG